MTVSEFSIEFDTLYSNITSNLSPGLTEYEKSFFLTKAQEEIVKNHFSMKSNAKGEGLNNSIKRDTDFSTLFKTIKLSLGTITENLNPINVLNPRVKQFTIANDYLFIINELCIIKKKAINGNILDTKTTVVVPIHYLEFDRLMSTAYKEPNLYETWRLINETSTNNTTFDLYVRYNWTIHDYIIRYIRRPKPIILETLTGGMTIDGETVVATCELNPILHSEVLNRAVELAKIAYLGNVNDVISINQRNE